MWQIFRAVMNAPLIRPLLDPIIKPILRPITRFLMGAIAIPIFRFILKNILRLDDLDDELENDLQQWFKGTLLLLAATRNMESALFGAVDINSDWLMALRVLLAISVIEVMPDQELFAIIHPGPPKLDLPQEEESYWQCIKRQFKPYLRGFICQHLNRSSPVFAIMAAIAVGWIGWVCFALAIFQYLIIGLITSKDRARDVLEMFDEQVRIRRRELAAEFGSYPAEIAQQVTGSSHPMARAAERVEGAKGDEDE